MGAGDFIGAYVLGYEAGRDRDDTYAITDSGKAVFFSSPGQIIPFGSRVLCSVEKNLNAGVRAEFMEVLPNYDRKVLSGRVLGDHLRHYVVESEIGEIYFVHNAEYTGECITHGKDIKFLTLLGSKSRLNRRKRMDRGKGLTKEGLGVVLYVLPDEEELDQVSLPDEIPFYPETRALVLYEGLNDRSKKAVIIARTSEDIQYAEYMVPALVGRDHVGICNDPHRKSEATNDEFHIAGRFFRNPVQSHIGDRTLYGIDFRGINGLADSQFISHSLEDVLERVTISSNL